MDKEHKASIDGDQWAQCVRDHGWLWNAASAPASATLILAHGAGAPMDSGWMNDMAARQIGAAMSDLTPEHIAFLPQAQPGECLAVIKNDVYRVHVETHPLEARVFMGS